MIVKIEIVKIRKYSNMKKFKLNDIIKNQKVSPADTASALNLGDETCILNWIYESD
jgi:hypothetical protein